MALKETKVPEEELKPSLQDENPKEVDVSGELASEPTTQPEEKPAKRPRRKKTEPKPTQSDTKEDSDQNANSDGARKVPKTRVSSRSMPTDEPVIAIGERREVETESDKAKNHLLDLLESYKAGRILTDVIQGVEKHPNLSLQFCITETSR